MRYFVFVTLLCTIVNASAQDIGRKLPQNVNRINTDNFLPIITPDGKLLYYFTNYTNFGDIEVRKVERLGNQWTNPKDVDPKIFNPSLNHKGSIFFSYMSNEVYFSTRKSPVIGGYDIKVSESTNNKIGEPVNIGKPVNSRLHEGAPTLTPDGNVMYFMRCTSMDADSEGDCKVYSARRKTSGLWEEPVVLPDNINQADTRFPVILPDGETLIFSSNMDGSAGGFDLYMSRKEESRWTDPEPLDFINTEEDEMRVTAPLPGDRIYYSIREERYRQLYFSMLPTAFKAKPVRMYKGHVFDQSNNPMSAVIQAIDISSGQTIVRSVTDTKGSFQILLPSGHEYDFSIFADGEHIYYSDYLDMRQVEIAERKFLDAELDRIADMSTLAMRDVVFNEDTSRISEKSSIALDRLAYILKQNPDFNIEIGAFMNNYREDTLVGLGLTQQDTLVEIVSTVVEVTDSVMTPESLRKVDSLLQVANEGQPLDADSLRRSILSYKTVIGYDTLQTEKETVIFHNDRTSDLASQFREALLAREIDAAKVSAAGYREDLWDGIGFEDRQGFLIAVRFRKRY